MQSLRMETYGDFAAVRFYLSEEDQDDIDDQTEVYTDDQTHEYNEVVQLIPESIRAQIANLRRKNEGELGHGQLTRIITTHNEDLSLSPGISELDT